MIEDAPTHYAKEMVMNFNFTAVSSPDRGRNNHDAKDNWGTLFD